MGLLSETESLITKQKRTIIGFTMSSTRKRRAELDENEDGARASIIEEGISTFVFARALERNLFEGLDQLDYDLLKQIQVFARGFEVERCSPWQWEQAILDGFKVFRELKRFRHGWVIADLDSHTLNFEVGEDDDKEESLSTAT
jgi:hypothetical protein